MDPVSKAQSEKPHSRQARRFKGPSPDVGLATQFKPGQSGNPGGRSKKQRITKIFEQIFENATDRDEIKDSLAITLKSGKMASVLLLREAAERLEGRVQDNVNVTGEINVTLAETIAKRRKRIHDIES